MAKLTNLILLLWSISEAEYCGPGIVLAWEEKGGKEPAAIGEHFERAVESLVHLLQNCKPAYALRNLCNITLFSISSASALSLHQSFSMSGPGNVIHNPRLYEMKKGL
jgi:hypothetical protein